MTTNINVIGDGNKTSLGDYIEVQAPDVCPSCEIRYLTEKEREWCRHCEDEYNRQLRIEQERLHREQNAAKRLMLFICLLFLSGLAFCYLPKPFSTYASFVCFGSFLIITILMNVKEKLSKKEFYKNQ